MLRKYKKVNDLHGIEFREKYIPEVAKPTYVILGLPDAGLVGGISTEFLISNGNFKEFAQVYSESHLPPISHISSGIAKSPISLYHRDNFILVHSWAAIPSGSVQALASALVEYLSKFSPALIISITGLPVQNRLDLEKPSPFWIANDESLGEEINRTGLMKRFEEGYIAGPYAPILLETARRGIRNLVVVVESFLDLPDPEAAAVALDVVSKYTGIQIDTSALLKEAEEVRAKIKGLMEQTRKEMPGYTSVKPSTYA
ncbi:hypothetical protein IC006_1083 [Sulfuracidifex tepidarius]|uniref:PAC2 family protein n=1 Tax=Sulfuracidifex tepidarius TaxID=1294262 RepID=A0A510DUX6_9CREN|nr:hypothetical protein IC006_1083 [Sulfuracidifex tepidarius]BBG26543.1 hypothetical protein IC007_1058 [Sulfuracidifex tepidarius]